MIERRITTEKYDVDLQKLLTRRLTQCSAAFRTRREADAVCVHVDGADALETLSRALALLLCRDLAYFELAHMVDEMPLSLTEKQTALADALSASRDTAQLRGVRTALIGYLPNAEALNLEGFIRFRMHGCTDAWALCAERAAAEQMLAREFSELLGLLAAYVQTRPPRMEELSVCLHPDGSCTLSDGSDARIEYIDCSEDGVVSMLVNMAPARLIVYDLSDGQAKRLADALLRVFAGRVHLYR